MKTRSVEKVLPPIAHHWVGDGFKVHNFIPANFPLTMERMSPFLVLDYNAKVTFPPSERPRGVGVHPHKGFETVTIAYHGRIQHHDSSGGGGIIGQGDVQWMTAAGGILHKEYHEKEWSKKGGLFQMVQLWVNLPARHKLDSPGYQAIVQSDMGKVVLPDGVSFVEVIAGEYGGVKGPASTFTPIHLFNLRLKAGAVAEFNLPPHFNTGLLAVEGNALVNGTVSLPQDHYALMANDASLFSVTAQTDAVVLLMSGEPINEPIAAHGPFVMNTRQELIEAFEEFNSGKFGFLEDEV